MIRQCALALLITTVSCVILRSSHAFSSGFHVAFVRQNPSAHRHQTHPLCMAPASDNLPTIEMIPGDEEGIPIPFVDTDENSFIECYADSIATVNGVRYTIGCPCDYAVALTYFDKDDHLIPIELDDELMDDVYPVAESIVSEEFGEELALERTPQTLTLVGELEDDEEDMDDDDDDEDDMEEGEEEVEVLISFEHRGTEFNLVRLLDPVLLVGKDDKDSPGRRLLLSREESEKVMPVLEGVFLEYQEERDTKSS